MDKKNNKFSLSIDNSSDYLSIAILDKIKIVKVKHYKLQRTHNFDDYFVYLHDFFNDHYNINSLYVGCGPGSFSGIRKTISFAKALKASKGKNFYVIGVNSLAALAHNYAEMNRSAKSKKLLVVMDTKCNDFFVQLYEIKKKKSHFTIYPKSEIEIKKLNELIDYADLMEINKKEVTIVGLPESIIKKSTFNMSVFGEKIQFPSAVNIGKIGFEISEIDKKLYDLQNQYNFFNFDLNPIYARAAKTN